MKERHRKMAFFHGVNVLIFTNFMFKYSCQKLATIPSRWRQLMGNLNMRTRYLLAGAIAVVFLVAPAVIGAVQMANEAAAPHRPATAAVPGYALDTQFMRYCKSGANPSVDRVSQFGFLDEYEVSVVVDPVNGSIWLDYDASESGGRPLIVRYYAGTSDKHPCTFALLRTANHPEWDATFQRFTRAGTLFRPAVNQQCYSSRPPFILPSGPNGENVATLRCDILEQE